MRKKMRLLLTFLAILSFTGPTFVNRGKETGGFSQAHASNQQTIAFTRSKHSHRTN